MFKQVYLLVLDADSEEKKGYFLGKEEDLRLRKPNLTPSALCSVPFATTHMELVFEEHFNVEFLFLF